MFHSSLGMQVVHSYGEKPNEDFLQYYGFVDIENVHDAYTADLMHWVKQHFHAETGRVQAVEKSSAASKLLRQVIFILPNSLYSNAIIFLICSIYLGVPIQVDNSIIMNRQALAQDCKIDVHTFVDGWHGLLTR